MGPARRFLALLARPFARRLELRIVALFLGLLLAVQVAVRIMVAAAPVAPAGNPVHMSHLGLSGISGH